jgi:hypothetical protein
MSDRDRLERLIGIAGMLSGGRDTEYECQDCGGILIHSEDRVESGWRLR